MLRSVVATAVLVSCALAQSAPTAWTGGIPGFLDTPQSSPRVYQFDPRFPAVANFTFGLALPLKNDPLPPTRNVRVEEMSCTPQRFNLAALVATKSNNLTLVISIVNGRRIEYAVPLGADDSDVSSFEWNPASSIYNGNYFALHMTGSGGLYGTDTVRLVGDSTLYKTTGTCKQNDSTTNSSNNLPLVSFSSAKVNITTTPDESYVSFVVSGGTPPYVAEIQYPGTGEQYDVPLEDARPNDSLAIRFGRSSMYLLNVRDANGTTAITRASGLLPVKTSASPTIRATAGFLSLALAGAVVVLV